MLRLTHILALVIFTASTGGVVGQCSYLSCDVPLDATAGGYCGSAKDYLEFLKKSLNAPDCSSYKTILNTAISSAESILDSSECDGATALVSSVTLALVLSVLSFFLTKFK